MKRRAFGIAALAGVAGSRTHAEPLAARVAAASDLQFALPAVASLFERDQGLRVELSFGSSGNIARQMLQGAPLDLFLSADERFALRLAEGGVARDRGVLYGIGRIAAIVPKASTLQLDDRLDALHRDLRAVSRFAIANPEHAPYGRAARQALERLELWAPLQPHLVFGENVSQATQYVAEGVAQAGITALSIALAPPVGERTRHLVLPDSLHEPLRQRMVLARHARPAALAFYDFLQTPAARDALARHGFSAPGAAR